jgi:hypothetical protein
MPKTHNDWRKGIKTMQLLAADRKLLKHASGCCMAISESLGKMHAELADKAERLAKELWELSELPAKIDLTKPF